MRVLLLTSVNPIVNGAYYKKIVEMFKERKDITVVSIPFFAEIHAQNKDKFFLPTLFSMFRTLSEDKKVNKKVLGDKNIIVVGNLYNDTKFDMIVSLGVEEDENKYINEVLTNEKFSEFKSLSKAGKLYRWSEAEINLPTLEKMKLFLEGVFKNDKI